MNKEQFDKNIAFLKENGISLSSAPVWNDKPFSVELETSSPAGEDMIIDLEEPTREELQRYIDHFDIDENVSIWWPDGHKMEDKGLPFNSMSEQIDDYKEYLERLQDICDRMPDGKGNVPKKKKSPVAKLVATIVSDYRQDNVCMTEFLACKKVPAGTTYEQAFEAYIAARGICDGDTFSCRRGSGDRSHYEEDPERGVKEVSDKPVKVCVLFGETASNAYLQGKIEEHYGKDAEDGRPLTFKELQDYVKENTEGFAGLRTFDTPEEAEAYKVGVDDNFDWPMYTVVEDNAVDTEDAPDTIQNC